MKVIHLGMGSTSVPILRSRDFSWKQMSCPSTAFLRLCFSAYFKEVYKINSDFLKSGSEYVEAESEEMNKVINDQVEEMSKNAPAGTEGVVAMTKSSLAASSSTYESMTKAAKQVFDIVDSNIEAASKAGESAVSPSVGKSKGKKAA